MEEREKWGEGEIEKGREGAGRERNYSFSLLRLF